MKRSTTIGGPASFLLASLAFLLVGCKQPASTEDTTPAPASAQKTVAQLEAAVAENPLNDAYFGETHVHSRSPSTLTSGGRA